MATKDDSGGLVDRRSMRELKETSVGGKRAPLSARKQLEAGKKLRKMLEQEKKRREALKKKKSVKA